MADDRRQDNGPRRVPFSAESSRNGDGEWRARAGDELRPWFGDDLSRQRRGNDERDDRFPYGGHREDRASRWEGPRDAGEYGGDYATGAYRTDDRGYHERYRQHEDSHGYRDRDGEPSWALRERGGYWRHCEPRAPFAGRGPRDYRRSDDRVREEICDRMTDDPMLDASDIVVQVSGGVVTLSGTVWSRGQKRRAEDVAERVSGVTDVASQLRVSREATGHSQSASQPVSQAYGSGTPTSKSTSGTSA